MPAVLFTPCPPPVYVLVPDSEQRTSWTVYLRDVPDPTRRPAFPVRKGCVPFFGVLRFNLTQHEVQVSRFKRQIDAGNPTISVELLGFVRNWLLDHILKVDKALARDLNARGLK